MNNIRIALGITLFASTCTWVSLSAFADKEILLQDSLRESTARGQIVYEDLCMNCHMADGKGVENVYPPLAQSDYLLDRREDAIRAVLFGLSGVVVVNGKTYNHFMSNPGLNVREVADVMNYILNSWGNTTDEMVTVQEVMQLKE